ncbi:MAG TPA: SDR family oxidoreductase [Anaerolineaceae bacterium]|jgi:NAD(P)-dependent dehydrogenase (short-subunit alcohol dehydrogenase family)|nr:SDR family oxidoreductase [Longilinea sp.]HNS62915.1 SDR family oxidoreductase [Anaerolineaceae bacterium]HNZ00958.1 SDR family oxidoreductase [Anaerolineaceae bacterium]HOH19409.1 SDR family oxidoreductase [Anaerolineaceae bacterium]HOU43817.1 SDR family oxidoreductase [Anaerolineaceae bacterium]
MHQPDLPLLNKTILITGAARRIGRELALGAARAGANILLHHAHSPGAAEETAKRIQDLGRKVEILPCDFSNPPDVLHLVQTAWNIRPFEILVNSASIFSPLTVEDTSLEDWQTHLNINLTAPFLLSQSFARLLPQDHVGRIINILDWRALQPGADHLPYTISKAALAALTRSLAISFAPRITVNGLALGAILPAADGSNPQAAAQAALIPRFATMDELVHAFLFLAAGTGYVTGEVLHLDGGRHLR